MVWWPCKAKEAAETNLVTNSSLQKPSTYHLFKNCLKPKAVVSWRASRNIKQQFRLRGVTTQVSAGWLTKRSRISEYFQTLHSMFSWDLTRGDTLVCKHAACESWYIQADESVWQAQWSLCKHKDTLLTDTERRRMARTKHDSKFTMYKRDKRQQKKWGPPPLHMSISQNTWNYQTERMSCPH